MNRDEFKESIIKRDEILNRERDNILHQSVDEFLNKGAKDVISEGSSGMAIKEGEYLRILGVYPFSSHESLNIIADYFKESGFVVQMNSGFVCISADEIEELRIEDLYDMTFDLTYIIKQLAKDVIRTELGFE